MTLVITKQQADAIGKIGTILGNLIIVPLPDDVIEMTYASEECVLVTQRVTPDGVTSVENYS